MKKDHPQVIVRIRPSQSFSELQYQSKTITISSNSHEKKDKVFEYNRVFSPQTTNKILWEESIREGVDTLIEGRNLTLIAYGVTGSGKTHTIFGNNNQDGLASMIFSRLISQYTEWEFGFSFYQIYNQNIVDLLSSDKEIKLHILEQKSKSIITNLTQLPISTYQSLETLIQQGMSHRSQSSTFMNQHSSRSHAILQLTLSHPVLKTKSKITIIDLAGSQRTSPIDSSKQMMEGSSINKSLLALGNCLNVLSDSSKSGSYVPYRDSKLTRILKDSLSGNARLVMVACISGNRSQMEETMNTLVYASRASRIKWVQKQKEEAMCNCGWREKYKQCQKHIQILQTQILDVTKQLKSLNYEQLLNRFEHLMSKQNKHTNILPTTNNIDKSLVNILKTINNYKQTHNNVLERLQLITRSDKQAKLVTKESYNSNLSNTRQIENVEEEIEELHTQRMKRDVDYSKQKKKIFIKPRLSSLTLR